MSKTIAPARIKLIIIDLYGIMTFGSYKDTCQWLCRKYGFDYQQCYQLVYHKYFCQAVERKISERESFALTAKALGIEESGDQLRDLHISYFILNRAVLRWALARKKEGYKILLLSKNTPSQFRYVVEKYNLKKYFRVINTYYIGIDKKSPNMVKYILKKYGLEPAEILMTDDQDFNLAYPAKIGAHTILYKDFTSFKRKAKLILNN
ncbi:MAG: HAD family hydrolase [Patescibacteria group bacterium]